MLLFIKYLTLAVLFKFNYSATPIQGKVNGRLMSYPATPLKNSVVSLASDSLVVRITRTNEKGYFAFNTLPKGNYRIMIMLTGYEKYITDFFSLTEAKPSIDFKNIELRPTRL